MEDNSYKVWSGSLVNLPVFQGDPASVSATLTLISPLGVETSETAPYETVDGKKVADLSYTAPVVNELTVYDYYISENFTSEPSSIYPDPSQCEEGNCDLPTITVCPLGDNGES